MGGEFFLGQQDWYDCGKESCNIWSSRTLITWKEVKGKERKKNIRKV